MIKIPLHVQLLLAVSLFYVLVQENQVEAKGLRMRVLGAGAAGGRSGGSRRKPWDSGRDRNTFYEMRYDWDDLDFGEDELDADNFPCVGLCYYMKLQRMKNDKKTDEKKNDRRIRNDEPKKPAKPKSKSKTKKEVKPMTGYRYYKMLYSTEKPCVGLCYHYKKLGIPNPYAKDEEDEEEEDY